MKTRVMQIEPEDLPIGATELAAQRHAKDRASRLREWAAPRKRAILGALALMVAVSAIGIAVVASKTESLAATSAAGAVGRPDFAAIDRFVRSEMDAQRIPGLALG